MSLADLLTLDEAGPDLYRAAPSHYEHRPDIFGGQLIAQTLRAAGHTVPSEQRPSSIHLTFAGGGRLGAPVDFAVGRIRDGRSFSTRQVTATQGTHLVLVATVTFHRDELGVTYDTPIAEVSTPEEISPDPAGPDFFGGIELRELPGAALQGPLPEVGRTWVRLAAGEDITDPLVAACAIGFASDMRTGPATAIAGGVTMDQVGMMTSLDHALWFHRPVPLDDWLLMTIRPVADAGARALVLGTVHDRDGRHLTSFTQELLIRSPRPDAPRSTND